MRPAPGDEITAIDNSQVLRGVVGADQDNVVAGYFRWYPRDFASNFGGGFRVYREDTEGLSWIRGWHHEESDDVQALLAANRLDASAMGYTGASITLKVRGVPFPIEFADWTHDRLYEHG
jgi:hypothetical protein